MSTEYIGTDWVSSAVRLSGANASPETVVEYLDKAVGTSTRVGAFGGIHDVVPVIPTALWLSCKMLGSTASRAG